MGISISNPVGITVELDANALSLTGGTVTGGTTFSGGVEFSGPNGVQIYDSELFFGQQIRSYNGTTENELIIDSSQINLQNSATLSNLTNTQLRFEDGITDITIDATGVKFPNPYFNSGLFRGSFDSGRNSYNGISLVCTQGIELNWQAGYLKALNGSSVVPINVESDIVLTKYVEGGEDLPPAHTITTTISLDGGISFNGNNDWNDHSFALNQGCVSGTPSSDYSWGLDSNGVGGDDPDHNFGLSATGVGGFNDYHTWGINTSGAGGNEDGDRPWSVGPNGFYAENEADTCELNGSQVTGYHDATGQTWSLGINGLTFVDGTTLTTAGGVGGNVLVAGTVYDTVDSDNYLTLNGAGTSIGQNGSDDIATLTRLEFKISHDLDFYSSLTNNKLVINQDADRIEITGADGIKFKNGVEINSPSAGNSGLSQSGNIEHSDYPKEIQLVINGVTYAIPARIVT